MRAKRSSFEAQLGALRDVDFGIYPYTTSSNVIGAYAPIGAGIPGRKLDHSIGIMKAYSSCVGDGPFTAELAMTEEEKHHLREAGHEYGAATGPPPPGRPRRPGGQPVRQCPAGLRRGGPDAAGRAGLHGAGAVVTAYALEDGSTTTRFPMGKALDTAKPVVEYLPGWHCDITAVRRWEDLPAEAQNYILYLNRRSAARSPTSRWALSGRPTSTAPDVPASDRTGGRKPCSISSPTAPAT